MKIVKEIIETYLCKHKKTKRKFTQEANISYMFLNLIINEKRNIGVEAAKKIEKATKGEIKAEWLLLPEKYREEIEKYIREVSLSPRNSSPLKPLEKAQASRG